MKKHLLFIDESGNSGVNLIDKNQPFFTLVGLGVDQNKILSVEKELAKLEGQTGLPQGIEIKGGGVIKGNFVDYVLASVNVILSNNSSMFLSVIERRFMIAAIIVDNLYDNVYNDSVTNEWTFPSQKRQNLANHFYNHLSEETLSIAAKALVYGDAHATHLLIQNIGIELKNNRMVDGFDFVTALSGALPHVDELSNAIASVVSRNRKDPLQSSKGTVRTPNATAFFEMLNRIEDYYRNISHTNVDLIFDSSSQFDVAFAELYKTLAAAEEGEIRFQGKPPIIFGFRHIDSFQVANSQDQPLLRSVDLFSAGIRIAFELIANQNPPSEINKSISFFLGFVAANLRTNQSNLYNYVIADSVAKKILPTFERYFRKK